MPRLLINTSAEPIANFGYTYYGQLGKLLLLQKGHFAKTRLRQSWQQTLFSKTFIPASLHRREMKLGSEKNQLHFAILTFTNFHE